MQLAPQHLGPAEEHPCLGRRVDLADRLEHRIPVGPPKVGRRPEPCDGVLIRLGVIDHDVGSVVGLDFRREILRYIRLVLRLSKPGQTGAMTHSVYLDMAVHVLRFDSHEQ